MVSETTPSRFGAATPGTLPPPVPTPGPWELTAAPKRRGRWKRLFVGVVLIAAGVGAWFWGRETAPPPATTAVLETTTAILAGATVAGADLRTVHLTRGEQGVVAADQAASVVGLVARTTLPAGALIQRSLLTSAGAVPTPSTTLVGLALKPGQLPDGVRVGDQVEVVVVPAPPSSGAPPKPLSAVVAPVWSVKSESAVTTVTVAVPRSVAPVLAAAASVGDIAIIDLGPST
jgi:hypothetical protein